MIAPNYRQLAAMDWPWKSEDPGIHIILVSDEQLVNLANHPDEAVEKVFPQDPAPISLREHCRQGAARGATKLRVAYDYFFGGKSRSLFPDTPGFQEALKKIHDVAQEFGLGLEPSIISPLELGVGYREKTGEAGRWMQYREGLRDPESGLYSVCAWQHTRWTNNKGPMPVKLIGARAFAFREQRIAGTPFFAVDPTEIVELAPPQVESMPGTQVNVGLLAGGEAEKDAMFKALRIRAHGHGGPKGLDRVLLVLVYETVEMDYFSPSASRFLQDLAAQYHDRGISLAGIYSDEMHIQQDWSYHDHLECGQFNLRYVSPGLERAFAARFGPHYADFAPYLVYFASHQHDFMANHDPRLPSQHVFGPTRRDIERTMIFRRQYFAMLEGQVVQLMVDTREQLETLNGRPMDAFYHATWAESPTCDAWAVAGVHNPWSAEEHRRQYEYTPDFLWSNTVHQAASACADYFSWNDYLSGGNNDTAEGGYSDRNYYGRALACSLAELNRRPLASAGMWGMPAAVRERMRAVNEVFGVGGHPAFRSVADYGCRQTEVLFLYPLDLVAVDERFGSWMVQFGYANYITADKLVERGAVTASGKMAVGQGRYHTICALYEPFPPGPLLDLLTDFVDAGGTLIWSGVPALRQRDEAPIADGWWRDLFGIALATTPNPAGLGLPARQVTFGGALGEVAAMAILTDLVVDRVFPAQALAGTEIVATLRAGGAAGQPLCVGTRKVHPHGGQALFLGFRPRDDQAASTGSEVRAWFDILHAVGAYPASGRFAENDNPTVLSRSGDYLATSFANGAVAICPHYRHHEESWPGGFFRDKELDEQHVRDNPLPVDDIDLQGWHIAGQEVTYRGRHAVAWRQAGDGRLLAFAGFGCNAVEVDGRRWQWSEGPVDVAWHPLTPDQATLHGEPLYRVWCGSTGRLRLPLGLADSADLAVWQGAFHPIAGEQRGAVRGRVGYGERPIPFRVEEGDLLLDVDDALRGHWLYVVRERS